MVQDPQVVPWNQQTQAASATVIPRRNATSISCKKLSHFLAPPPPPFRSRSTSARSTPVAHTPNTPSRNVTLSNPQYSVPGTSQRLKTATTTMPLPTTLTTTSTTLLPATLTIPGLCSPVPTGSGSYTPGPTPSSVFELSDEWYPRNIGPTAGHHKWATLGCREKGSPAAIDACLWALEKEEAAGPAVGQICWELTVSRSVAADSVPDETGVADKGKVSAGTEKEGREEKGGRRPSRTGRGGTPQVAGEGAQWEDVGLGPEMD